MTEYDQQEIENNISKFWKENSVREKVRQSTNGNEKFFMIDGPPYLNGEPHVGHMQGKVLKDVMLRFKQMQGYDVWDQAGFDTHGLPNELATEEEMGIEDKNEIGDSVSAEKFIEECRRRATSAKDTWKEVMGDLAIWQDFENPYMTYDKSYVETAWWLLNKTENKDLLYQGRKPIHWCPRCQTSLSGYEVTDEYQEIEDYAVYAKFPLENREEKLVIWTTTPWTIPSNMAVFTNPNFKYAVVKTDKEKLIIAEQLVPKVMEKSGYQENEYNIERTMPGSDLKGMKYKTPFQEEIPKQKELSEEQGVHQVHNSKELVSLEDGTGLVHAATGHGPEDYEETRPLGLPVFSPIDSEGFYTEEAGDLKGENVLDVDPKIIEKLEEKRLILNSEKFTHEYPHCWRCKTELIYRAADQWFIENTEIKQRMLEENKKVQWVPENKQKRFHDFVSQSPDWCISRQNYWGIPIPVWTCNQCEQYEVVGSFKELEEKVGTLPEDFDPHKNVVDRMEWECQCGGTKSRIPDIFDVWYDSGCAPFASLHYPFENKELFEEMTPMDFITEASDQIRGWFYHLMFCGILGFDQKPYEKILFQGYVLRADGEKMSKSSGTTISPKDQVESYGADLPRFYQLRLAPAWEQKNYDEEEIRNEIYRMFSVYWNTKEFLLTHKEPVDKPQNLNLEDEWILSKINSITSGSEETMNDTHFHEVARELEDFVINDLSRWYVKRVRTRIKNRDESAIWTLNNVLMKFTKLMAPFTPYITEQIYQDLEGQHESVHMEEYPEAGEEYINEELEKEMDIVREIIEKSNKIRDENQYNLRWPAKRLVISTDEKMRDKIEKFDRIITDMANVKKVEYGEVASSLDADPDYSSLGPKFGENAERVASLIEQLDHEQIEQLNETGQIELEDFKITLEDVEIESKTAENLGSKSFKKGEIFLDLNKDQEIRKESFVSEVVRSIQQKRKEAGLDVNDKVKLSFEGENEVLKEFEEKLKKRINTSHIEFNGKDYEYSDEVEFEKMKTRFTFSEPLH